MYFFYHAHRAHGLTIMALTEFSWQSSLLQACHPSRGLKICPVQPNLLPMVLSSQKSAWISSQAAHMNIEPNADPNKSSKQKLGGTHRTGIQNLEAEIAADWGSTSQGTLWVPAINSHLWIKLFGTRN